MHDTFQNLCVCISLSGAAAGSRGGGGVCPKVSRAQLLQARKAAPCPDEAHSRKKQAINEAKLKTEAGHKSCLKHFPKIIS